MRTHHIGSGPRAARRRGTVPWFLSTETKAPSSLQKPLLCSSPRLPLRSSVTLSPRPPHWPAFSAVEEDQVQLPGDAFFPLPCPRGPIAALSPSPLSLAAPTPLMVVSAPSTALLLAATAAAVVASASEGLSVRSVRSAAMLAGPGPGPHAVAAGASVETVAL